MVMLHKFLEKNKKEILLLSEDKTKNLAGARGNSEQLQLGLPLFYQQLIKVLKHKLNDSPPAELLLAAADHGKEFLRMGYSLSHVVHAYGAMCQAITELATMKDANITASEFNILNGCLDVAIASAVSEYQFRSVEASEALEVQRLGFLAHELRNALSSATIAHEMIKAGLVGTGGSTAYLLESSLSRMRLLIDRSLSEVRLRADAEVFIEKFRLSDLFDQIIMSSKSDAEKKKQSLECKVDWRIEIEADRQFILSAVANLIQNAIKYTKSGGIIRLNAKQNEDRILIEVKDQCGGIESNKLSELFTPFTKASEDQSGLGLGLSITQRAVHLSQGKISVRNIADKGCVFTIDLPLILKPETKEKATVPGVLSVQPNFRKRT